MTTNSRRKSDKRLAEPNELNEISEHGLNSMRKKKVYETPTKFSLIFNRD